MEPTKKKRGRKPLSQKKIIDKNLIQLHLNEIDEYNESLVAHIPLTDDIFDCNSIIENDIKHDIIEENNNLKKEIYELKEQLKLSSRFIETNVSNDNNKTYLINLPIINLDSLKPFSDILCWWCCHKFDQNPIFLPNHMINNTFFVFGIFCSLNCACSYNYERKDNNMLRRHSLLYLMYKNIIKENNIIRSPPRELLLVFGGNLSIEDFRKNSIIFKKEFKLLLPPFKSIFFIVEEDQRSFIKNETKNNIYVPLNKKDVSKAKLKLKRNIPLQKKHICLEETLGLIKKQN